MSSGGTIYPKEDSTWVLERDITLSKFFCGSMARCVERLYFVSISAYFHDPKPGHRSVMDAISDFVSKVPRSLRCGVNRLCSYSLVFRSLIYLFGGKERVCPRRLGKYFDFRF